MSIAVVTESWLTESISTDIVNIKNYVCHRRDRDDGRKGGGLCCYTHNDFPCKRFYELDSPDIESMWLLYRGKRMPRFVSHIAIGVYYHPPNGRDFSLTEHITSCADYITKTHPYSGIVILGDFNSYRDRYLLTYPFKQTVRSATRNTNILDKIYTNIQDYFESPVTLPPIGRSDHNCILMKPKNFIKAHKPSVVQFKLVRSCDRNGKILLAHALKDFNWFHLYKMTTPDEMIAYFNDTVMRFLDTFLPMQYVRCYQNDKPWVNESLRSLIRHRQSAWCCNNKTDYNRLRNKVQRMARNLKISYYNKCIRNMKNMDPRKWWSSVKKITGQSNSQHPLSVIAENVCNNDMKALSERINQFLKSVSDDLEPLSDNENDIFLDRDDDLSDQFVIYPWTVQDKLDKINIYKSSGPDEIPNWFLRDFSPWLAEPLCCIFNTSVQMGIVPSQWKRANVVPIPKTKNHPPVEVESDLRPISLTPTVSKILESIVGTWILELTANQLDKYQFGGVKGKSTTHALVDILHHWHSALNDSKHIVVLFIDYAKAFDHVDHNIFIQKLYVIFKLPKFIIRWIKSFLTDRKQRVKIENIVSDWISLKGGLPQGSWLGPLIFILFINDLKSDGLLHKFIDDVTASDIFDKNKGSTIDTVFRKIDEFSTANNMRINYKKTKIMPLCSLADKNVNEIAFIKHDQIETVRSFKLLGVEIDYDLKFTNHITAICAKANSRIHFIKLLKRSCLDIPDLLHYYYSIVRPVIEYACPAWHFSLTGEQVRKIEMIQKRALSLIFGFPVYENYQDFCSSNNIQTLSARRDTLCKSFFEKAVLNKSGFLHYLLPPCKQNNYSIRNPGKFQLPKFNTSRFRNSFILAAGRQFNF